MNIRLQTLFALVVLALSGTAGAQQSVPEAAPETEPESASAPMDLSLIHI